MFEKKKPIVFVPSPTQLGDTLHHLHCFLLAAKECGCIKASKRKAVRIEDPRTTIGDFEVHIALRYLEIALNPQRLAMTDAKRTPTVIAGWPNILRFARLWRKLQHGVDTVLVDWRWEGLCTSTAMVLSIAGIDGHGSVNGTLHPGTVEFKMARGWRPLVRQSIVEDLVIVRDAFAEYLAWYQTHHQQHDGANIDELVTLAQVAPLTGLTKRTLERYVTECKLPSPDFRGGNGKSSKWYWSNLRSPLEKHCKRVLPVSFPGGRIV